MAKVTFEMPDESLAEIVSNYSEMFGYRELIPDADGNAVPNPESPVTFTANRIISDAKKNCSEWQRQRGYAQVDAAIADKLAAVNVIVTVE